MRSTPVLVWLGPTATSRYPSRLRPSVNGVTPRGHGADEGLRTTLSRPMATKSRLDALLVDRGLFETRSRAAAAVIAGEVRLGDAGRRADKPGQMVAPDVAVAVAEGPRYVSRGGVKLANALDAF